MSALSKPSLVKELVTVKLVASKFSLESTTNVEPKPPLETPVIDRATT